MKTLNLLSAQELSNVSGSNDCTCHGIRRNKKPKLKYLNTNTAKKCEEACCILEGIKEWWFSKDGVNFIIQPCSKDEELNWEGRMRNNRRFMADMMKNRITISYYSPEGQ